MTHIIRPTEKIVIDGRTYEFEKARHHRGKARALFEADVPLGWEIPSISFLETLSTSLNTNRLDLDMGCFSAEFVRSPSGHAEDREGLVAVHGYNPSEFHTISLPIDYVMIDLGGRYIREIHFRN